MTMYHADHFRFQPITDAVVKSWRAKVQDWVAHRRKIKAQKRQEELLAGLDPQILDDIGVSDSHRRRPLPGLFAYSPHLVVIDAMRGRMNTR